MEKQAASQGGWHVADIVWKAVWRGYAISLVITLAAGVPLLLALESMWLLGAAGLVGLLGGGVVVGARAGRHVAIINSALMGIMYSMTIIVALFAGWVLELLPEPLPGLPQGDSTFFFAWPLMLFAVSIAGGIVGSRLAATQKVKGA